MRDARIAFEVPEAKELPPRLDTVLDAIHATYGTGWDDITGADARRKGLAAEAITLGKLLLQLLPGEPEVQGLLALMLYCEARLSPEGDYVPLSEQDTRRWSWPLIEEAHQFLMSAAQARHIGHFQLEAAIQSAHTHRAVSGLTNREEIALLDEGLVQMAPTIGVRPGRVAAIAEARGAALAWSMLESIPLESVATYQPYWALAAHLLATLGRNDEARAAYSRAIGLCENPATREYLVSKAVSG